MKFKEGHSYNIICVDMMPPIMPEPEVGKVYHAFDDGKITIFRLIDWKITKRIDLDHDKVSKHLIQVLQREIKECYWLYDAEQTVIFHAKAVDENGKYNKEIGTCYFIRTKSGGWFGACGNTFFSCELDVDNRWYDSLMRSLEELGDIVDDK